MEMRGLDPDMAVLFLDFVAERHRVWEHRQNAFPQPWTLDPILANKKFTNVFRILDPGTQFIMTDLLADGPDHRALLMRLFLYRHTGRVEAWQQLPVLLGGYPSDASELDDVLLVWQAYRGAERVAATTRWAKEPTTQLRSKRPIFTGAYNVHPPDREKGSDKLVGVVEVTKRLFTAGGPNDIMPRFMSATDQAQRFAALRDNDGVADFMSMQILTDWGYTPHSGKDRENLFVVPGPGARAGAAHLAPGAKAEDVLRWAVESVGCLDDCPKLYLGCDRNHYRQPSYMDVQNCLCEFSKYVRYTRKPLVDRPYHPAHPGAQPLPVLPQHWL